MKIRIWTYLGKIHKLFCSCVNVLSTSYPLSECHPVYHQKITSHVLLAVFCCLLSFLKFLIIRKIARGGALRNYSDRGPTLGFLPGALQLHRVETPFHFWRTRVDTKHHFNGPEQKMKELRPRTNRNFKTQGVDLAYQQTGISGVGYCWTTQKYFTTEKQT